MPVECYEILHAGEGPRGRLIPVIRRPGNAVTEYAEEAARWLDVRQGLEQGWSELGHRNVHHIEVVGHPWHPGPLRFAVRCEVVRRYTASEA